MRNLRLALAFASLLALVCPASAQTPNILGNEFPTHTPGKTVVGVLSMCLDSSGFAVPTNQTSNCPGGGGGGSGLSVPFAGPIGTNGTPGGFKDGSGNLQPLLGDVTNGEWVSVKASVLPTGAATQATLASILSALGSPFQAGASIGNTAFGATQSGTWNINNIAGTISLPTGAGTAANQTTLIGLFNANSATIAHTCSIAGYSLLGCLGQIDDDIKGPIPAGSNTIGAVTQASGPWTMNWTQLNSVALGSPSNYGTSPGAVAVPGVNAFVTNTPPVSQSGTWTVQPGNTPNTTPWLANPTSQYPSGATAITGSATGTTAATTATLAGTSGKTTYVCGYSIRANATANTNVTNTLTGVISGTMSSIMWVPANTAGLGVDEQIFNPCIPASAANTAINAVSGAPGTGGLVSSKIWGYQQ